MIKCHCGLAVVSQGFRKRGENEKINMYNLFDGVGFGQWMWNDHALTKPGSCCHFKSPWGDCYTDRLHMLD